MITFDNLNETCTIPFINQRIQSLGKDPAETLPQTMGKTQGDLARSLPPENPPENPGRTTIQKLLGCRGNEEAAEEASGGGVGFDGFSTSKPSNGPLITFW